MLPDATVLIAADAAPVAAVLATAPHLFGARPDEAAAAAERIRSVLAAQPIRLVVALDHAFRDRGVHRQLGLDFVEGSVADVQRLAVLEAAAPAALGVASMLRSGFVREAAVARLDSEQDPLATAFLLARVGDYVTEVAEAARGAVERRLSPGYAGLFVASLPIVRRMEQSKRGAGAAILERVHALLGGDDPACEAALWEGTGARDSEVRREACKLLAARHAGRPEVERALAAALADPDPATRLWAAEMTRRRAITPPEVQAALLERMERDRAPGVRLLALRGRARAGAVEAVAGAAFDGNANVRFYARKYLRSLGARLDQRAIALEILERAGASRAELVGALATLSELGRAEDAAAVERFLGDERATVAREARRTMAMLKA